VYRVAENECQWLVGHSFMFENLFERKYV